MIKNNYYLYLAFLAATGANSFSQTVDCSNATTVQTFSYTGSPQTFTVPTLSSGQSISNIHFEVYGAQGGLSDGSNGGTPGLGGFAAGSFDNPTSGSVFEIDVGAQGSSTSGGYNGGAFGGLGGDNSGNRAGGGGGASDIKFSGTSESNRIIVAGGGGGAGSQGCSDPEGDVIIGGTGGAGGGSNGTSGADSEHGGGGFGGDGTTGGSVGTGCNTFMTPPQYGSNAIDGVGGIGGEGPSCCCSFGSGGGGGGGFAGGGGGGGGALGTTTCIRNGTGGGGGGTGGSNFVDSSLSNSSTSNGVRSGDGEVRVCYSITDAPVSNLQYQLIDSSSGSGAYKAPTIDQVSSDASSVTLSSCFNFKKMRKGKADIFAILRNNAGRTIMRSRVKKSSPCAQFSAGTGRYSFHFQHRRHKKQTLKTKNIDFAIIQGLTG